METKNSMQIDSSKNALALENEIKWFRQLLSFRFHNPNDSSSIEALADRFGIVEPQESFYANFVTSLNLSLPDRVLLLSAFIPEIDPGIYQLKTESGKFFNLLELQDFAGKISDSQNILRPNMQVVLFMLSGGNIEVLINYQYFFKQHSTLIKQQIITLHAQDISNKEIPWQKRQVYLAEEYTNHLLHGTPPRPDFGANFPATITSTNLNWDDLVVKPYVIKELNRISKWQMGGKQMIANSKGKINGSFPCLFYGSSGAGKTLAAQLLGKKLGVDVFRIDLSMVVSKYIGETEKNLAYLFDRAKGKNWILLFDEADALFGKRTDIKDSKDKWANLEMSYLLQRMEEHQGLTILTTNYRHNLDMALTRRFQSVLYFNRPDKEERKLLWQNLMPEPYCYPPDVIYDGLAHYELTGADISNVIKAACLEAECRDSKEVNGEDLMDGIKREFAKENRSLN